MCTFSALILIQSGTILDLLKTPKFAWQTTTPENAHIQENIVPGGLRTLLPLTTGKRRLISNVILSLHQVVHSLKRDYSFDWSTQRWGNPPSSIINTQFSILNARRWRS